MADQDEPLPGLGDKPTGRPVSPLETAIRRAITALSAADMLTEVDAVKLQLMLEIAETSHDMKLRHRTSMIHQGWRLLWEIVESFTTKDPEVDEQLKAAMAEWAAEQGVEIPGTGASP